MQSTATTIEAEDVSAQPAENLQDAPECAPCAHAVLHGWWGPMGSNKTHCRRCHRSWASRLEMHCVTCHRHFANPKACDAHQPGSECQDPMEVLRADGQPKFVVLDHGRGPVFKLAFYGTRPTFPK